MSRNVIWQRVPSDCVSWRQDQALNSTIYILREVGPTSFLLKEDGVSKKFKVSLGDPHTCTCTDFKKEKELCKHICWVLLKKFKLQRQHELSYQLGLVEREINEVLKNPTKLRATTKPKVQNNVASESEGRRVLEQREVTSDDVCPICQDNLLSKRQPVTFCRYGCGNSVHIKCMKVWADHQRNSTGNTTILCPFCREEFGSQSLLAQEFRNTLLESKHNSGDKLDCHLGVKCSSCGMEPIKGKCYKCSQCSGYHLCNTCYHNSHHQQHSFVFRLKKAQRWRTAPSRGVGGSGSSEIIINPILNELQSREITENDYDALLQLDSVNRNQVDIPVDLAGLPDHLINRLPMSKVKQGGRLTAPGKQCRLCLHSYEAGQFVRRLPSCGHIFHRICIDEWLRNDHRRCPIDRHLVFDPDANVRRPRVDQQSETEQRVGRESTPVSDFVVPGIGLLRVPSSRSRVDPARSKDASTTSKRFHKIYPSPKPRSIQVTFNDILAEAEAFGSAKPTEPSWVSETNLDLIANYNGDNRADTLQRWMESTNKVTPAKQETQSSFNQPAGRTATMYRNGLRRKSIAERRDIDRRTKGDFSITGSQLKGELLFERKPVVKRRVNSAAMTANSSRGSRFRLPRDRCNASVIKKLAEMKPFTEPPVAPASSPTTTTDGGSNLLIPHHVQQWGDEGDVVFPNIARRGGSENKGSQKPKQHRQYPVKVPREETWKLSKDGKVTLKTNYDAMGVAGMPLSRLNEECKNNLNTDDVFVTKGSHSAPAGLRSAHLFTGGRTKC